MDYGKTAEKVVAERVGMTTRQLDALVDAAEHPLVRAAAEAVLDAADEAARIDGGLRDKIAEAQRDLHRAVDDLDAGLRMNEHGILQYTGTQIDILAARRADAYARLKAACRTAAAALAAGPA